MHFSLYNQSVGQNIHMVPYVPSESEVHCNAFILLFCRTASEMTYCVSGGALNSTHSLFCRNYWQDI